MMISVSEKDAVHSRYRQKKFGGFMYERIIGGASEDYE